MKFSIKQAGIIVAIFAIIALAVVGCFCAVNVSNGRESDLISKETNFMTTADTEYLLEGSNEDMAKVWSAAMFESIKYNRHIKLTLMNDWVAEDDPDYITSFGEGYGLNNGRLNIIEGAEITLDLNGNVINKNLTGKNLAEDQKQISLNLIAYGTLNLMDSKYNIAEVNKVYEQYKNQVADVEEKDRLLLQNLSKIKCGKITGNDSKANGCGVYVEQTGVLNMYGGMIVGNKTTGGTGGAIHLHQGSVFNMYNGAIVGNSATAGGGIFSIEADVCNIQGGIIAENATTSSGGGLYLNGNSDDSAKISNCIISHNRARAGGGLNCESKLNVVVDNVEFIANYAVRGSAMRGFSNESLTIKNTKFTKNIAEDSGTLSYGDANAQLKNVEITDNVSIKGGSYNIRGGSAGLSIVNSGGQGETHLEMNNVLIKDNVITDPEPANNNTTTAGMYLYAGKRSVVDMRNVRIVENVVNSNSEYAVGGFVNRSNSTIRIVDKVIIHGNKKDDVNSNAYFDREHQKFTIAGALHGTYIGITLGQGYTNGTTFTLNYTRVNGAFGPNRYFYSDNMEKDMAVVNDEVMLSETQRPTQKSLTWRYKANDGSDTAVYDIKGSTITLEYNPAGYTITNSIDELMVTGSDDSTASDKAVVTNLGNYSFTLTTNNIMRYTPAVLTFAIVPKKVDIEWSNTELTYNGNPQKPTAKVKGDASIDVNVSGVQINVGNGYIATATSLNNNANYVINPTTSSTTFNIKPATLQINVITKNFEREYNGKIVSLPNDWYLLSANRLGQDANYPLDLVFDIDYNAFIPQFNGKDSAIEVGEYTISTKRINADDVKNVFSNNLNYNVEIVYKDEGKLTITVPSVVRPTDNSGYDFVFNENGRRVNYKDIDLIHGDNDSAITTFVLGNITPNTSVQTFVNNLSFDTTKITIYNKAGEVVFGAGAISYYTDNINNGLEVAIGTGWRIEYTKLTGGEETIYLSVLGDLTGDGKVNATDVNYIRQLISNPTMYASLDDKPYIQLAAMIINNGKLTNADGEILWNIVCGKMEIKDFL